MPDFNASESSTPEFGTPFQGLIDHCEAHRLSYFSNREEKSIRLTLCRGHASYKCCFRISHDDQIFQVDMIYPVLVRDEKMRPAAFEFFTRANCDLILGGFQLDCRDGEVSYHVGHVIADGTLDDETISYIVSAALSTSDTYFPAFMRLLFAGETPEDAIFLAELDRHSEEVPDQPAAAPAATEGLPGAPRDNKAIKPAGKPRNRRAKQDKPANGNKRGKAGNAKAPDLSNDPEKKADSPDSDSTGTRAEDGNL